MTHYTRMGSSFRVASNENLEIYDTLPIGTYVVEQNPITGEFYLDRVKNLESSGKVYGDAPKLTKRILNTFMERDGSTGVLLSGEKGSGKTLQAKLLSIHARDTINAPTILVNRPFRGDAFNQFMQTIEQPVVVLFDEFEKVYDRDEQEAMLTLLDGVYPSKKLFVLTCNDKYRINDQMKNRPGRLFYRIEYSGLDADFIREFGKDNLADPSDKNIDDILSIATVFVAFNFDMLKSLVEEMNRYGEDARTANRYLNARPSDDDLDVQYDVDLFVNGKRVEGAKQTKRWSGNPIDPDVYIWIDYGHADDHSDDEVDLLQSLMATGAQKRGFGRAVFNAEHLKDVTVVDGVPVFTFESKTGEVIELRRHKSAPVYSSILY